MARPHNGKSSSSKKRSGTSAPTSLSIANTLTLAERTYDQGDNDSVLKILSPLESRYPFADSQLSLRYDRLLAFVYANLKRLADAEQVIRRGLEISPQALDLHYTNCYVKLSLREFEQAIDAGRAFLKIRNQLPSDDHAVANSTKTQLTHLLNFMGSTYQALEKLTEAADYFQQAIDVDPGNHLPYLNLANLQARGREWGKVSETIERGLKQCRRINELRMLADTYKKKATVSACIMVKNEEEMLPGCLDSLREWVDEIIIVDTGSTDRTLEIAENYGAKIYHHPWEDSFSQARNYTLQYATCDWILVIDADERIVEEDVPQIIQMLNQEQFPLIAVNVFNHYPHIEDMVTFLPSKRLFRRSLGLQYSGIVHNQLIVPESTPTLKTGIQIKHYGYGLSKERMEVKIARTKALLEKQLAAQPDDAFALFNYAQLHRASPDGFKPENAAVVLRTAGRALEITSPDNADNRHIYYMCLDQLAWTHYYLKEFEKAEEYCLRALKTKPDYLDPLLLLGYVYYCQNDFDKSRQFFEKYLAAQAAYKPADETENIILLNLNGRADALFNLGVLAEMRKDWRAAKQYFIETLNVNPNYHSGHFALARLYLQEGEIAQAESNFSKQLAAGKFVLESLLSLANIAAQRAQFERAESFYQQALKADGKHFTTLVQYARFCARIDKTERAVELYHAALDAGCRDASVSAALAEAYSRLGHHQEAVAVYDALIQSHGESPIYLNDLGNCYYRMGEFAQAEGRYEASLKILPDQTESRRNLGLTQARLGKSEAAIANLKQYLRQKPEDTDIQHVIGDLYLAAQAPKQALSHFEEYLKRNPQDSRAFFRLAECYLLMGHKDSAILGYQKSLQLDPLFTPAQDRLENLLEAAPKL